VTSSVSRVEVEEQAMPELDEVDLTLFLD